MEKINRQSQCRCPCNHCNDVGINRTSSDRVYQWHPISEGGWNVKEIMINNQTIFNFLLNIKKILSSSDGKISKEELTSLANMIRWREPETTSFLFRHIATNQIIILKTISELCNMITLNKDTHNEKNKHGNTHCSFYL